VHKEVRLLQVANNVTARSVAPMLAVKLTLQFDYIFAAEVRKTDNGADKKKEQGELQVHLFRLLI
jgi:hypothetical protein